MEVFVGFDIEQIIRTRGAYTRCTQIFAGCVEGTLDTGAPPFCHMNLERLLSVVFQAFGKVQAKNVGVELAERQSG